MRRNIVAIIQARMGSSRLPGKVLMPLYREPALKRVLERVSMAKTVHEVVVATSVEKQDKAISDLCADLGYASFRGDEDNVLKRVYETACAFNAEMIVDITADCPLVDPHMIDTLVKSITRSWQGKAICYASNIEPRSWPDGFDIQVYTMDALTRIYRLMKADSRIRTEHVGWNILQTTSIQERAFLIAPQEYWFPKWGLTLDTEDDLRMLDRLIRELIIGNKGKFNMNAEAIIRHIIRNPELLEINEHVTRKIPGEAGE